MHIQSILFIVLTFHLDAFKAHSNSKGVFHCATHLLVMIVSGYVKDLVIKAMLARNLTVVNGPLVAVLEHRRIGDGITMESSLHYKYNEYIATYVLVKTRLGAYQMKLFSLIPNGTKGKVVPQQEEQKQ